jgi:hypothetical protein
LCAKDKNSMNEDGIMSEKKNRDERCSPFSFATYEARQLLLSCIIKPYGRLSRLHDAKRASYAMRYSLVIKSDKHINTCYETTTDENGDGINLFLLKT